MRLIPLPLLLLAAPLAEIVTFGLVVQWLGFWSAFALLLLTSAIGFLIVRQQGFGLIRTVSELARNGRPPARQIGPEILTLVAGLLLMAPGFLTDLAGLLLLVPFVRKRLSREAMVKTRVYSAGAYTERYDFGQPPARAPGQGVVDLDAEDYHRDADPDADGDRTGRLPRS